MASKEKAIAIVKEMVENGYSLFDETIEEFAQRMNYDIDLLEMFKARFTKYIAK